MARALAPHSKVMLLLFGFGGWFFGFRFFLFGFVGLLGFAGLLRTLSFVRFFRLGLSAALSPILCHVPARTFELDGRSGQLSLRFASTLGALASLAGREFIYSFKLVLTVVTQILVKRHSQLPFLVYQNDSSTLRVPTLYSGGNCAMLDSAAPS